MLNHHPVLTCFLLLLAMHVNAANTDELNTRYEDCIQANQANPALTNSLVAACAEGASEAAKKEMNRAYQRLYLKLQKTSQEEAQQLEEAQKAWLVYRNAHCDMLGKYVGSPMYYTCPMELNIGRVAELQFLLDNGG